jgi:hypothetical protein
MKRMSINGKVEAAELIIKNDLKSLTILDIFLKDLLTLSMKSRMASASPNVSSVFNCSLYGRIHSNQKKER